MPFLALKDGFKTLYPNDCYDFDELLEFCLKEQATKMLGVPTLLQRFCEALKKNPKKYEPFRGKVTFASGGSAIPAVMLYSHHFMVGLVFD